MQLNDWDHVVKKISAVELKNFIHNNPGESYNLVDVREPSEYETSHIPGAQLIPLGSIMKGDHQLTSKPTFVYCRSGKRSATACQILVEQGFTNVYDLSESVLEWTNPRISGPYAISFDLFNKQISYQDAKSMLLSMEKGLKELYEQLKEQTNDPDLKALYHQLAGFEEHHISQLIDEQAPLSEDHPKVFEGGFFHPQLLDHFKNQTDRKTVLESAMTIEAKAYDLYRKMARDAEDPKASKAFHEIADEEIKHFYLLAEKM